MLINGMTSRGRLTERRSDDKFLQQLRWIGFVSPECFGNAMHAVWRLCLRLSRIFSCIEHKDYGALQIEQIQLTAFCVFCIRACASGKIPMTMDVNSFRNYPLCWECSFQRYFRPNNAFQVRQISCCPCHPTFSMDQSFEVSNDTQTDLKFEKRTTKAWNSSSKKIDQMTQSRPEWEERIVEIRRIQTQTDFNGTSRLINDLLLSSVLLLKAMFTVRFLLWRQSDHTFELFQCHSID